ncbi:MAG: IS1634 family transposase [Succinivibrio sp.]
MYIALKNNKGTPTLLLMRSLYRDSPSRPGRKSCVPQLVKTIGPLRRFDDGKEDYVGRLRQSFREGRPLIPELLPYCGVKAEPKEPAAQARLAPAWNLEFEHPRWCAQILLDPVFKALGLSALCATLKHSLKLPFDFEGWVKLVVYCRILSPCSKLATSELNSKFFRKVVGDGDPEFHVYEALDVVYDHRLQILRRLNSSIAKAMGGRRDTSILYYDVTNFYFEKDQPDPDEPDAEENVERKGLRKIGVSKEHRPQPIVQMPMFLDNSGLPVAIGAFPGNTLDSLTASPMLAGTVGQMGIKGRFIYIADRGVCSWPLMCALEDAGDGYIMRKGLRGSCKADQDWALDEDGFKWLGKDFRYKSRIVETEVELMEDGPDGAVRTTRRKLRQKCIVYWSRSFYDRDAAEHRNFLEFVRKLRENKSRFRVPTSQAATLRRFMSRKTEQVSTGRHIDSSDLRLVLDNEKIDRYCSLMGLYQLRTSELDMDPLEAIDKYHGLSRIEDLFREMKVTLEPRPVFLRCRERIHAHLLLCMIALLMVRIIQRKWLRAFPPENDKRRCWTCGLSGRKVAAALRALQVDERTPGAFAFCNADEDNVLPLLHAFGIDIRPRLYTLDELRHMRASARAF